MTISISTSYTLILRYLDTDYYFTKDGICINVKRGKIVKRVLNGGSYGYCLNGKFETLKSIRNKLNKVEKNKCPF
jgi:hypothetical protein